jgi:hypothetical protein
VELIPTLGNSCRSVALSSVANYYGYHLSEAMCFGIGETLDFSGSDTRFGLNKVYKCYSGNNENDIFRFTENMNMDIEILQLKDGREAKKVICHHIRQGRPVIARVSLNKYMKYLPMTATDNADVLKSIFRLISGAAGNHVTLITNTGRDQVLIHEPNIDTPILVPWRTLIKAMNPRNAVIRHPSNTIFLIKPSVPAEKMEREDRMGPIIWNAIYNNMKNYLFNQGYWAGVEQIEKSGKSFLQIQDPKVYEKSVTLFRFFCDVATGGGFYRRLYGRFLKEASDTYIHDEVVEAVSKKYFALSRQWSQLSRKMMESVSDEGGLQKSQLEEDWMKISAVEKELSYTLFERSKEKRNAVRAR